jgi:hypothetical protein
MLTRQFSVPKEPTTRLTRTVTLNAAFLQEIKEVNGELWEVIAKLQQKCAAPISMRLARPQLIDQLEMLRDLLGLQFTLEEAYGYFDSPADVQLSFSSRVETLREEHETLYKHLIDICDEADMLLRAGKLAELTTIVPIAFDRFFQELESHERRECELIVESACTDFGVGD